MMGKTVVLVEGVSSRNIALKSIYYVPKARLSTKSAFKITS